MIYVQLQQKKAKLAVVGLGYVGLPIALEFAKHFDVVGFDINSERVRLMQAGIDPSRELTATDFEDRSIVFTDDLAILAQANFFIIAVPTDIDEHRVPNLKPLKGASRSVGKVLKKGDYVVYESTVYPGCTEDDCCPILEAESGLRLANNDFKIGYSPERINPGDKTHTVTQILKIVAGNDAESLAEIAKVYGHIIMAGIYEATSIKVAEAAKVIENTQRDLNISLMNELAIIFDKMGINTRDVIAAAATKWNFVKLYPGLVGGHCIGVDPYYLLHKAREIGVEPQVIASGRRINDGMPAFVAKKTVQLLTTQNKALKAARVLVMGVTFKENVTDIRNSKVAELIDELRGYSLDVEAVDAYADAAEVLHEYHFALQPQIGTNYDAIIVAVNHAAYSDLDMAFFKKISRETPLLIDIKGSYGHLAKENMVYWSL
jgi:UDP-N-acetyl-D-glucosamine/UDP-N-acetyl-D-galactosamine dehydrogenase